MTWLDDAKARQAAATPGPWGWDVLAWPDEYDKTVQVTQNAWTLAVLHERPEEGFGPDRREADADFIAHAPDDIRRGIRLAEVGLKLERAFTRGEEFPHVWAEFRRALYDEPEEGPCGQLRPEDY